MRSIEQAMSSAPIHIHAQPWSKHWLMQLSVSLGLALLVFLAFIFGSFHHHHDLQPHPDCAICAVGNHAPAELTAPPSLTSPPPALPALIIPLVFAIPFTRPVSALGSRAPPR